MNRIYSHGQQRLWPHKHSTSTRLFRVLCLATLGHLTLQLSHIWMTCSAWRKLFWLSNISTESHCTCPLLSSVLSPNRFDCQRPNTAAYQVNFRTPTFCANFFQNFTVFAKFLSNIQFSTFYNSHLSTRLPKPVPLSLIPLFAQVFNLPSTKFRIPSDENLELSFTKMWQNFTGDLPMKCPKSRYQVIVTRTPGITYRSRQQCLEGHSSCAFVSAGSIDVGKFNF
jgi:hypothetical protein